MNTDISKLLDLQKKINILEAQKQFIQSKQKNITKIERKERTRTLIQAGSLLKLLGYFELCDIGESDDLQHDNEGQDRAAVLIGILEEMKTKIPPLLSHEEKEKFKTIGIRVLKMRGNQK